MARLGLLAKRCERGYGDAVAIPPHPAEPHVGSVAAKLNWLRAGVLGANDGIVSTAGLVVGVAAATAERGPIPTAGIAGLAAGAVSMALGEYVSVSTQRDTEKALLSKERRELREMPGGRTRRTRRASTRRRADAGHRAHRSPRNSPTTTRSPRTPRSNWASTPDELTNPWHAACPRRWLSPSARCCRCWPSCCRPPWRIPVTFVAVLVALALTGAVSARLGGAPKQRAVLRNVIGGGLAMAVTYGIGHLVGAAIA